MSLASVPGRKNLSRPTRGCTPDQAGHVVRFYTDDSSYLDGLCRTIEAELKEGGSVVVIATRAHRDGMTARLNASGLDITGALQEGRYILMDAAETLSKFMLQGMPDPAQFADAISVPIARAKKACASGNARVSAFGEMVAVLWAEGKFDAAVGLEQLWNQLKETHSFSLHCAYPMKGFDREEHGEYFLKICGEHSGIVPDENHVSRASDQDDIFTSAYLQQTTQALKTEKKERTEAEELLRRREAELAELLEKAHDELEMRVAQRTIELERMNLHMREQANLLESNNQGLRDLSARLLHVQDEERKHIARELHDSSGQTLALLTMTLSSLESETRRHDPKLAKSLADNAELARQVSVELRTLSYLLHPPLLEEVGLRSALEWFVDRFAKRSGIFVNLDLPQNMRRFPRNLETAIYRIVQECLTNIHRHSQSPVAFVRLSESAGGIVLEIIDEGKGIDQRQLSQIDSSCASGVGLRGIRERVQNFRGNLALDSDAKGTRIKMSIPLGDGPTATQGETK